MKIEDLNLDLASQKIINHNNCIGAIHNIKRVSGAIKMVSFYGGQLMGLQVVNMDLNAKIALLKQENKRLNHKIKKRNLN